MIGTRIMRQRRTERRSLRQAGVGDAGEVRWGGKGLDKTKLDRTLLKGREFLLRVVISASNFWFFFLSFPILKLFGKYNS